MAIINLQEELARRQKETDLLANRTSPINKNVNPNFISNLAGNYVQNLGANTGRTFSGSPMIASQNLNREVSRKASQMERTQSKSRLDRLYALGVQRGIDAGYSEAEARQYAQQLVQDEIERQNQMYDTQSANQTTLRRSSIADANAMSGVESQPSSDYNSAMLRAMFGLTGATASGIYAGLKDKRDQEVQSRKLSDYMAGTQKANVTSYPTTSGQYPETAEQNLSKSSSYYPTKGYGR